MSMTTKDKNWGAWCEFFLLSFASLFFELLVIRWMSADIRAFSVFKTFPLVACFIGLGAGYALQKDSLFRLTPCAILIFACIMKFLDLEKISQLPFPSTGIFYWQYIPTDPHHVWVVLGIFAIALIMLLIGPFGVMACIGSRLGHYFNEFRPLPAYCVNIGGAILGSLAFTVCSFAQLPPAMLLCIPGSILLYFCTKQAPKMLLGNGVATVAGLIIASLVQPMGPNSLTLWSPYQRIDFVRSPQMDTELGKRTFDTVQILYANRSPYQYTLDSARMESEHLTPQDTAMFSSLKRRFQFPFLLNNPREVLIVGAGMGSDVGEGLKSSATRIDAVDIDPVILRLGKQCNPAHVYDSDRVNVFCNDARNYFNNCTKQYDLIVFSHLDSHVVTSGSSLRIDNYLYTVQSFQTVLKLLKPGGLLVVSFDSHAPWFGNRLYKTLAKAAGYEPLEYCDSENPGFISFVLGDPVASHSFNLPAQAARHYAPVSKHNLENVHLLTDDWPYLYVTPNTFDLPYLFIVCEISLLAFIIARRTLTSQVQPLRWQMFFLGAAFMLLELQAISRLSLLFGATWLTSAIVINCVLLMILFANLFVLRFSEILRTRIGFIYTALCISLLLSYLLSAPISHFSLNVSLVSTTFVIALITVLPVLFAGIIFAISFDHAINAKGALAYNLFGAFFGSLLEYLSNYLGINALVLVALILYLLSWLSFVQATRQTKAIV